MENTHVGLENNTMWITQEITHEHTCMGLLTCEFIITHSKVEAVIPTSEVHACVTLHLSSAIVSGNKFDFYLLSIRLLFYAHSHIIIL